MKNYNIKIRHLLLALFAVIIVASLCEEPEIKRTVSPPKTITPVQKKVTQKKQIIKKEPDKPIKTSDIDPEVQKLYKQSIIDLIEGYNLVRAASFEKDGNTFKLVIIVDYSISKDYAKNLGDGFVRSVKAFYDDTLPGKEIGKGKYNYLVGVYYLNGKELVMGAKASSTYKMTW